MKQENASQATGNPIISMVVAIAENNGIGKDNQLLWHLPADLKHFKETTTGHSIIMGRKTYDSIGRPLPNRRNVVLTRSDNCKIEGVEVVNTIEEAIALCANEKEVFIIGGAEIYKSTLEATKRIYLTVVHEIFEADAYFPEIVADKWNVLKSEKHEADEKNAFAYTFSLLERK